MKIGRALSLIVALFYVGLAFVIERDFTENVLKTLIGLMLPMFLIWFPDEIGAFTGTVFRGGNVDVETPPILISIMGWFFLVGLPLLFWFLA